METTGITESNKIGLVPLEKQKDKVIVEHNPFVKEQMIHNALVLCLNEISCNLDQFGEWLGNIPDKSYEASIPWLADKAAYANGTINSEKDIREYRYRTKLQIGSDEISKFQIYKDIRFKRMVRKYFANTPCEDGKVVIATVINSSITTKYGRRNRAFIQFVTNDKKNVTNDKKNVTNGWTNVGTSGTPWVFIQ